MTDSAFCSEDGCNSPVQKQGHTFCPAHYKKHKQTAEEPPASYVVTTRDALLHAPSNAELTSTQLGELFGLEARQINRVLRDLGWIEKEREGWRPSSLGEKLKAQRKLSTKKNNPYPFVVWHQGIRKSSILKNAINELLAVETLPPVTVETGTLPAEAVDKAGGFRDKFPPQIRASDGHMVRSRAEALIDGWLYGSRIVHAYESRVPVEQEMYCDFYLPEYSLYIEFWGMESNSVYKARKEKKLEIYRKNELKLVEVRDEHIKNIDDYLMSQLVKFGYKAK